MTVVHELAPALPSRDSQGCFLSPRLCQLEHWVDLANVLYSTISIVAFTDILPSYEDVVAIHPLVVPPKEGLKWSRITFSPCPRAKLDNQRLFLPRQVHLLIFPNWVRFIAKLHIEVPNHARKNKSRLKIS